MSTPFVPPAGNENLCTVANGDTVRLDESVFQDKHLHQPIMAFKLPSPDRRVGSRAESSFAIRASSSGIRHRSGPGIRSSLRLAASLSSVDVPKLSQPSKQGAASTTAETNRVFVLYGFNQACKRASRSRCDRYGRRF